MITAAKFFIQHLNWRYLVTFCVVFYIHLSSYVWYLDADKYLTKRIPKILANIDDTNFSNELINILISNVKYLIIYAISMFVIEIIGKLAIRNAVNNITEKMLKINLSKISNKQYEHEIISIVQHSENVSAGIRNLIIELPRKIVACYYFLVALHELSLEIMFYCTVANILFILVTIGISCARKYFLSKVATTNINLNLICSDLANSIQTYKVDDRLIEYQNKINNLTSIICINSSLDALMVIGNDAVTSFSGQFMIGLISYVCRPMVINKIITFEDLMYGVRSSSKFVEKIIGMFEYFGEIIRQYKSFEFFVCVHELDNQNIPSTDCINSIIINTTHNKYIISPTASRSLSSYQYKLSNINPGHYVRIIGANGVGKTTLLLKFLGIAYQGAISQGKMDGFGNINAASEALSPTTYRSNIAFVQQQIPLTHDTVSEYICAVSKSNKDPLITIKEMIEYFNINKKTRTKILLFINSIGLNKPMRELSGGQAKFIQIIASVTKLYNCSGKILILDEPSNNLDPSKIDYIKELLNACISRNKTIFIVTHDNRIMANVKHDTIELRN